MPTVQIAILALQGILFAVWAIWAFVILFQLRRRGVNKTGSQFPGPLTFIDVTSDWLADPAARGQRNAFAVLTAVLFAISALFALTPA
jgi:hypothetical protein